MKEFLRKAKGAIREAGKLAFSSTPMSREEIAKKYPMTQEQKKRLEESDPFLSLWPTFGIHISGWTANDRFRHFEGPKLKAKFFFDKSHIPYLAGSKFATKIGLNSEAKVPHKFIGFCYTTKERRAELEKWLEAFPQAGLITNVDESGLASKNSRHVQLPKTSAE